MLAYDTATMQLRCAHGVSIQFNNRQNVVAQAFWIITFVLIGCVQHALVHAREITMHFPRGTHHSKWLNTICSDIKSSGEFVQG